MLIVGMMHSVYTYALTTPIYFITLSPHLSELAFELNIQDHLMGISQYTQLPKNISTNIPMINDAITLDIEKIIAIKAKHPKAPWLALAWQGGTPMAWQKILQKYGIQTIYLPANSVIDILYTAQFMYYLRYQKIWPDVNMWMKEITKQKQSFSNQPIKNIFYPIWWQPLMTVIGKQYSNDFLSYCKIHNIYQDAPSAILQKEALMRQKMHIDAILLTQSKSDKNSRDSMVNQQLKKIGLSSIPRIFATEDILVKPNLSSLKNLGPTCQSLREQFN